MMINMCWRCKDSGWVCETHSTFPSHIAMEGGCGCPGPAMPCPEGCSPSNVFIRIFAEVKPPEAALGVGGNP